MARGGKRSGAGRPKGSKSKESGIVKAECKKIEAVVEAMHHTQIGARPGTEAARTAGNDLQALRGVRTPERLFRRRHLLNVILLT